MVLSQEKLLYAVALYFVRKVEELAGNQVGWVWLFNNNIVVLLGFANKDYSANITRIFSLS